MLRPKSMTGFETKNNINTTIMKRILRTIGLQFVALLVTANLQAQNLSMTSISFQAALTGEDGQALPNGDYTLGFRFWDGPAPDATAVSTNILRANVAVSGGVTSTAIPVDPAWFNGQTRYLGISVNGASEMTPRVLVTTVPYAALAGVANQLGMGDSDSIGIAQMISQGGTPGHRLDVRGALFIGDWQPNSHPALVLRGANSPVGRDETWQDIHFDFSGDDMPNNNAGSARIRAWRGGSWDTYLEFMVNKPDEGHDRPITVMKIDSGSVDFLKGINAREGLAVTGTASMTVCQITSDRNAKRDFKPVNNRAILEKIAALPISTWAYTNSAGIRHLGPVAQDFYAAFGLGEDDKHIATVDADGVALAALQGLYQVLEEKEDRIHDLEQRLKTLEKNMNHAWSRHESQ